MSVPSVAIVGTGAVARALATAHARTVGDVLVVVSRDAPRASRLASRCGGRATVDIQEALAADVVVVAVSDAAVGEVGARLSTLRDASRPVVLHTSGALPGTDLAGPPVRAGSLHPLQSFPAPVDDSADADRLLAARVAGTHWFHEGAGETEARALVSAWEGAFHSLTPGSKALYHAGAAILSNHTVALFAAATRLFEAAGVPASEARVPLATLLGGTAANLHALGCPQALTGPVARGDVATIERHVAALRESAPELVASYVEMAVLAVDVAIQKGTLGAEDARRIRDVLQT